MSPASTMWAVLASRSFPKGWREGVSGIVQPGGVDDTTEQQGEVAPANVVEVGVGSPPCSISGWVGATAAEELGARGMLRRPVRRRGRARGQTASKSSADAWTWSSAS